MKRKNLVFIVLVSFILSSFILISNTLAYNTIKCTNKCEDKGYETGSCQDTKSCPDGGTHVSAGGACSPDKWCCCEPTCPYQYFPVPVDKYEYFCVKGVDSYSTVSIYDISGMKVASDTADSSGCAEIYTNDYAYGVYLILGKVDGAGWVCKHLINPTSHGSCRCETTTTSTTTSTTTTIQKPDLIISDFEIVDGQDMEFRARAKNVGSGTVNENFYIDFHVYWNDENHWELEGWDYVDTWELPLSPGEKTDWHSDTISCEAGGSSDAKAVADGNDDISEENENNNEKSDTGSCWTTTTSSTTSTSSTSTSSTTTTSSSISTSTTSTSSTTTSIATTVAQCNSGYSSCSAAKLMSDGDTSSGMGGDNNQYYKVELSETCDVTWTMSPNGNADYDLYTKDDGSCPSTSDWDCRPYSGGGSSETCTQNDVTGTVYSLVDRYSDSSNECYSISVDVSNCQATSTTSTSTTSTTSTTTTSTTISQCTDCFVLLYNCPSQVDPGSSFTISYDVYGTGPTSRPYEIQTIKRNGSQVACYYTENLGACSWHSKSRTLTAPSSPGSYDYQVLCYGSDSASSGECGSVDWWDHCIVNVCEVGLVCKKGPWSCDGDCRKKRKIYKYNASCNCVFDHWEYENAPEGQHCSGGSFTSSGQCGYSGWSCDGDCRKQRHAYECDGSNHCDYHDYWDYSNCPSDTACSGGSCVNDQPCSTGGYECKDQCTKAKRQYRCDGSNNCNEFWRWVSESSCDPYQCSGSSCSNTCESNCGASSSCDGKNSGESCGAGLECNSNCECVDVCFLDSASITSSCSGGTSPDCEQGETIQMTGSISGGGCPIDHFQIDAENGNCKIEFSGGDLSGIYGDSPSQTPNSISGEWTILSIPDKCKGKTISATLGGIYEGGGPGTGTGLGGSSASGSFRFTGRCIKVKGPYNTMDEVCW